MVVQMKHHLISGRIGSEHVCSEKLREKRGLRREKELYNKTMKGQARKT